MTLKDAILNRVRLGFRVMPQKDGSVHVFGQKAIEAANYDPIVFGLGVKAGFIHCVVFECTLNPQNANSSCRLVYRVEDESR